MALEPYSILLILTVLVLAAVGAIVIILLVCALLWLIAYNARHRTNQQTKTR